MKDEEGVEREDAQISGRTQGPFGTDDADVDLRDEDNKHRPIQENSANGLDSVQVRGGQDGRNIRGIGSTDMDSQHGLLRMGDQDNSTMEVTDEGMDSAVAAADKTNTGMVNVTTSSPDDYASADKVPVPDAQKAAKQQNEDKMVEPSENWNELSKQYIVPADQESAVAETGTDLNNEPTY